MFGVDAHELDTDTGYFISQKHKDIATVINEWNPDISLVWIPPRNRVTEHDREFPFAVVHSPPNKEPYIIFHVRETELDERIIARLWASDNSRHDVLGNIEAEEAARKAVEMRRRIEEEEERQDVMRSVLKSPKNVYRHNGVTYRD